MALGYCIDLADLDESCTQKDAVMQCAICIRDLLQKKLTRKNISYQLLLKKIPKQSYQDFRELYKDIRLSTTSSGRPEIKKRARAFWERHQATVFRFLLFLSLILLIFVILMFVSNAIWGNNPLLRLFFNPFKEIGTESLVK